MILTTFRDLSWVDRTLPLWILLAMALGILLSVFVPRSRTVFSDGSSFDNVNIPIAVGLIVMMIPPLCKVRWESISDFIHRKNLWKHMVFSLIVNWLISPFVMLALAWATLPDLPEYRIGVIMIGLARCIAMVLIWNQVARADEDLCAFLVVLNSVLQLILYAPYEVLFCQVISHSGSVSVTQEYLVVFRSVAFYLGIPLLAGAGIRLSCLRAFGEEVYVRRILRFISPWALIGLLYTIIVIFIQQGYRIVTDIGPVFRTFVPLSLYFIIMWFGTLFLARYFNNWLNEFDERKKTEKLCGCEKLKEDEPGRWATECGAEYAVTMTQAFTAASNNFELSIAVAIAVYGINSPVVLASTIGPMLEVPILLALSYFALLLRDRWLWRDIGQEYERLGVSEVLEVTEDA
jgi:arsenite transporter